MSKVLNFAGISRVNGELKFRTATEDSRFAQLTKLGDTDVEFVRIKATDSKQMAAAELLTRNFANGREDVLALIEAVVCKIATPKVSKPKTVKAKATKVKVVAETTNIEMTPKQAAKVRAEFMKKLQAAYEA